MSFYEQILADTGYQPKTTFWQDFTIADKFGPDAIKDTYERAFEEWKTDKVYLTELVMVLNWKIWEYGEKNPVLAMWYEDLWIKADKWCLDNLKGDDLQYYIQTTD